MRKFHGHLISAMNVYRNGGRVFFDFKTDGMEHQSRDHMTALTNPVPNATSMKRKNLVESIEPENIKKRDTLCCNYHRMRMMMMTMLQLGSL